jgi:hypothetical protein
MSILTRTNKRIQRVSLWSIEQDACYELSKVPVHPGPDWIERFTGSFKGEPAFAEVVAYGQAIRAADRPREDDGL